MFAWLAKSTPCLGLELPATEFDIYRSPDLYLGQAKVIATRKSSHNIPDVVLRRAKDMSTNGNVMTLALDIAATWGGGRGAIRCVYLTTVWV